MRFALHSPADNLDLLVEASDPDGTVTKIQIFRGGLLAAETGQSPLRFTLTNAPAGVYTFQAKAVDDAGFVTLSGTVTFTVNASGPVVSLRGTQPIFTSASASLAASVVGVDPGSLVSLTLDGNPVPLATGSFTLPVSLAEGQNDFTLAATDDQNRTAQAATTVYLYSVPPTVSITGPSGGASFATTRVNVQGSFSSEAHIDSITANGVPAFISGSTWQALNVPLAVGQNTIIATAQDIAGNTASASINVNGLANPVDPVQLAGAPVAGFEPLTVILTPQSPMSGIQHVFYDFDGDGVTDLPANDLTPVTHTYLTPGQFFPVVTIQTTAGTFSSTGGWSAPDGARLRINVQPAPQQVGDAIAVTDPVDLKATADGKLYILSRSAAEILEYDTTSTTPSLLRSLSGIGNTPTGLDVDSAGNVYVALSGDNQVAKFMPAATSFQLDTSFGNGGLIGRADKGTGTDSGEFNSPYDVAVSPDGSELAVSDSGNNRIQQFGSDGTFIASFGQFGAALGQFNAPKGLTCDDDYLYIVDSGNNRICVAQPPAVLGTSGASGTVLGQFQGALNVSINDRGIYVADTGNSRVQEFDAFQPGYGAMMTPLNPHGFLSLQVTPPLDQPASVAATADLLAESIYIADTGNNRVILVKVPADDPLPVWNDMVAHATSGHIPDAVSSFSRLTADAYLLAFLTIGSTDLASDLGRIDTLTPVFIRKDTAQYYFEQTVDGIPLLFPVDFVKENGIWKIQEF
jgi:hypothetical protein